MTETLVGVSPPSSKEPKEPSGTGPSYGELEAARELVRAARDKGVSLTASDGLLKALTKTVIETALEEEMSDHLGCDRHEPVGRNRGNSRNGKRSKTMLTDAAGEVDIDVPLEIRRVICSTNAIESLNARYRRAVKARGHFPTEQAAMKCLYLVTRSLDPKGTGQTRWAVRWKLALNAFAVTFADRMPAAENH